MKEGGPKNGRYPFAVAKVERSEKIGPVLYPEIEQHLLSLQLIHPRGNSKIFRVNDGKWIEFLNRFLVNEATVEAINGGRW